MNPFAPEFRRQLAAQALVITYRIRTGLDAELEMGVALELCEVGCALDWSVLS